VLRRLKAARRRRRLAEIGIAPEVELAGRRVERHGARSGVWALDASRLTAESVVYSFGVGDNVAWDLALIERHGVTVHAFDPTSRSIDWIGRQDLPERFRFHPIGLAGHDGELELFPPRKPTSMNYGVLDRGAGSAPRVRVPVKRLATLAAELGHERVDVLKMDVEGAELAALPDVLASGVEVGQLLVELHYGHPAVSWDETARLLADVRARGFRVLDVSERGYELTFLHPERA
jgi:FkbM family methyltransferase